MPTDPFVIEDSRHATAPPEVVLRRVLAPATWPEWQSEIVSTDGPEKLGPGDVVRGHAKLLGFEVEGHSTSIEVTDDAYVEDVIVGVRMRVRYSIAKEGDGSRVTHRMESHLPRGISGRVLALLLRRRLRRMQAYLLDELVRRSATEDARLPG